MTRGRPGGIVLLLGLLVVIGGFQLPTITSSETLDPCTGTLGADTVASHVCLNGETIAIAPATAFGAIKAEHGDMTFVTFNVTDAGRWAVMQGASGADLLLDPEEWTDLLRSGNATGGTALEGSLGKAHFLTPATPYWRSELEARGVTFEGALGDNWYLVNASGGEPDWTSLSFIDATAELGVSDQLSSRLETVTGNVSVAAATTNRSSVTVEDAKKAMVNRQGTNVTTYPGLGIVVGTLPADRLADLAAHPAVTWIEELPSNLTTDMNNIREATGANALHGAGTPELSGHGTVGLVVDAGLDLDHQDLTSSLISTVPEGQTVDERNLDARHGTEMFGIVFADGTLDAEAEGMVPDARGFFHQPMLPFTRYDTVDQAIALNESLSFMSSAVGWDLQDKAPTDRTRYTLLAYEMDRIVHDHGIAAFQSMDNEGPGHPREEALAKNVVSVGGIIHNNTSTLADDYWGESGGDYPSTGPADDGRIKPELVGPFDNLWTTTTTLTTGDDATTTSSGGTSAATSVVAGAGALVHQMYRQGVFRNGTGEIVNGTLTPSLNKALLVNSATSYDPDQVQAAVDEGPARHQRDVQGWGLPDLRSIYLPGHYTITVNETYPLLTGSEFKLEYDLPDDQAIKGLEVTLAWTDVPTLPLALESQERMLVNDLDLEVEAPNGTVYLGNHGLQEDDVSDAGGSRILDADDRNTVEHVSLTTSDLDTWTVKVRGMNVDLPSAPGPTPVGQPFSLVVRPVLASSGCCAEEPLEPPQPPSPSTELDEPACVTLCRETY